MTTESLPKEQLAELQDETYTLQRIPDLDIDIDLIWEALMVEDCNASKNKEIVEIEGDPLLLDHSHQLPVGEDAIYHKGLVFGSEKENSSIYVINKTCTVETSEGKKPEKGISSEILSEHFGKPLADAAESFHVSRSTFKRMCRDHGITRWKSSKRRMGSHSSSKHRTVNDNELSVNSSLMVIPPFARYSCYRFASDKPRHEQDKCEGNL